MFTMLLIFLVSLWAGLCALPSFAWMNLYGAFAAECLAGFVFVTVAVVVLLASIYRLLRIAVDLIHRLLRVAVDQIFQLPRVAVGNVYRLGVAAAAMLGRLRAPANDPDPSLTPLSPPHDPCELIIISMFKYWYERKHTLTPELRECLPECTDSDILAVSARGQLELRFHANISPQTDTCTSSYRSSPRSMPRLFFMTCASK